MVSFKKEPILNFPKALVFVCSLVLSGLLFADDGAKNAAEALLDTMGMKGLLEQTISQTLDSQLADKPELVPYKQVLLTFLQEHMSYESLKPDLVKMYADAFTESELKGLTEFYKTPLGQKALREVPELASKGAQLGSQRVQENVQELQQMMEAEAQRIQNLQSH